VPNGKNGKITEQEGNPPPRCYIGKPLMKQAFT